MYMYSIWSILLHFPPRGFFLFFHHINSYHQMALHGLRTADLILDLNMLILADLNKAQPGIAGRKM